MAEQRTWDPERFGWDVTGDPCYNCGTPTDYFVDEYGTPRGVHPTPVSDLDAVIASALPWHSESAMHLDDMYTFGSIHEMRCVPLAKRITAAIREAKP